MTESIQMASAEVELLESTLRGLLEQLELTVELETEISENAVYFNIVGDDQEYFQHNRGELLRDMTYLLHTLHRKAFPESENDVKVDAGNLVRDKERELCDMAMSAAQRAMDTGKEVLMAPLNPYERRIVHMALQTHDQLETESMGEGHLKRIAIRQVNTPEVAADEV